MRPSLAAGARVDVVPFGVAADGHPVTSYTLRNARGSTLEFLSLGGIIRALHVPDRHGEPGDVVLGFDAATEYAVGTMYLGALIGRYANRIAGARFTLDGRTYQLAANNGPNTLHGGPGGFDTKHWHVELDEQADAARAVLRYDSPDGEAGFPGALAVTVTYTWTDDDTLIVDYHAETSAPTPVNLTQHAYFNLSGRPSSDVLGHELTLHASRITAVDDTLIPTGELRVVDGTPFDFREPQPIGARLGDDDAQLRLGQGYDHNFVLDDADGALVVAARLEDPVSGRVLTISTTEPGIQVYSGNVIETHRIGKDGAPFVQYGGIALETQRFPDTPNQPAFPSCTVRPGVPYVSRTVFAFSAVA